VGAPPAKVAKAAKVSDSNGLLLDRELTHRRDKRLAARLRYARLRHQASVEDVDYRAPRGPDKGLMRLLICGVTESGDERAGIERPVDLLLPCGEHRRGWAIWRV
jgi:IstB-like ATP binding protein